MLLMRVEGKRDCHYSSAATPSATLSPLLLGLECLSIYLLLVGATYLVNDPCPIVCRQGRLVAGATAHRCTPCSFRCVTIHLADLTHPPLHQNPIDPFADCQLSRELHFPAHEHERAGSSWSLETNSGWGRVRGLSPSAEPNIDVANRTVSIDT